MTFTHRLSGLALAGLLLQTACSPATEQPTSTAAAPSSTAWVATAEMLACADGHASLVEGTGNFSRDINSPSPEAQDYFDQGLRLGYGYYFPEAVASFNAALCFDPDNARIHWARAQALGPNANSRNSGLPDDPQGEGAKALQLAIANMGEEPQQWKDMINALVPMFDMENLPDMATRSQAVIDSTRALYTQYPDDLEAAFTYTHAIMMASPWYYFEWDGTPRANTNDARAAMEKGMAQNPYHPGLTHLHVHLMEASREPVSAETSADALEPLTPMIGHMAHMPGHIFMRIGRYQDSIDVDKVLTHPLRIGQRSKLSTGHARAGNAAGKLADRNVQILQCPMATCQLRAVGLFGTDGLTCHASRHAVHAVQFLRQRVQRQRGRGLHIAVQETRATLVLFQRGEARFQPGHQPRGQGPHHHDSQQVHQRVENGKRHRQLIL